MSSPPNLAPELWSKIFTHNEGTLRVTGSQSPEQSQEQSPEHYHVLGTTTLRISHVCRLWRNVIAVLPELWSSFYIDYFTLHIIPLLELYLQRSAGRELFVQIHVRYMEDRSGLIEVLLLLMQHKGRFRELSFTSEDPGFPWETIYSPERPLFPLLKSLYFSNGLRALEPSWFLEGIRTPKLEKVELAYRTFLTTDNTRDMFTDSQVKVLIIQNIGTFEGEFRDFHELLSTLQRIETVKIDCFGSFKLQAPFPPLRKETLRTLVLKSITEPNILLSSLELPSLETLVLSPLPSAETILLKASDLCIVLKRFSSLHHFSFQFDRHEISQPNSAMLIELVESLPNLTTLDIFENTGNGGNGYTFNLLFSLASNPTLGRRLTSLRLEESKDYILDVELVDHLIEALETRVSMSKENGVARLTDVQLLGFYGRGKLPEEKHAEYQYLNPRLEQLEVEGVTCAIQVDPNVTLGKLLGMTEQLGYLAELL